MYDLVFKIWLGSGTYLLTRSGVNVEVWNERKSTQAKIYANPVPFLTFETILD